MACSLVQIGMLSEESSERSHKNRKRLEPRYITMHNPAERMTALFNQLHLQAHPLVEIYAPPDRNFTDPPGIPTQRRSAGYR